MFLMIWRSPRRKIQPLDRQFAHGIRQFHGRRLRRTAEQRIKAPVCLAGLQRLPVGGHGLIYGRQRRPMTMDAAIITPAVDACVTVRYAPTA